MIYDFKISCHSRGEALAWRDFFEDGEYKSKPLLDSLREVAIISISTPFKDYDEMGLAFPHPWMAGLAVLTLEFDDLDRVPHRGGVTESYFGGQYHLFGANHEVEDLVAFTKYCLDRGANRFYVHCDAGQSRSAGIAAALAKYYLRDDWEFFRTKTPNMLVYRKLLEGLHSM